MHSLLVIDHVSDDVSMMGTISELVSPTSCGPMKQQTSVVTITTTVQLPVTTSTIVVTTTPQSSCNCSNQQQQTTSPSSDSDVVTVCVPIVVVFAVIILIVLVVLGILIWRNTKSRITASMYDKVAPNTTTVLNDLYGLVYICDKGWLCMGSACM